MAIRAFDCVAVIENVYSSDDVQTLKKITCIECCSKDLFIGTSDGCLIQYLLEESNLNFDKIGYSNRRIQERYMNMQRKPITSIKSASALNRLLVLCTSSLYMLDLTTLEIIGQGPFLQGIELFCVNEDPDIDDPFAIQICVADKKKLKIFNVTDNKFNVVTEIALSGPIKEIAVDGSFICVAMLNHYKIHDLKTKTSQPLFNFQAEGFTPIIRRIKKGEFLLSAPEGLGMFVTADGVSNRPPIQWSCQQTTGGVDPLSLAYLHPYVIELSSEFLKVYSILDQQQKQVLPFNGGTLLGNFDGRIYFSSHSSVYALHPIPWQTQVQVLLKDKRVDEALELARNSNHVGLTKEEYILFDKHIQKQAAFILLSLEDFQRALKMFLSSDIDIREVISIYPSLLAQGSTFVRAAPPLHDIADVDQLFRHDKAKIDEARSFLKEILEEVRYTTMPPEHQFDVDTALLKLYAECDDQGALEAFIVAGDVDCDIKDCVPWLQEHGCDHGLALLYKHYKNYDMALQIWHKLISMEKSYSKIKDLLYFFIESLSLTKDLDLVWKYADFALKKDEKMGVHIFTKRPRNETVAGSVDPSTTIEFLNNYPQALMDYLEYLVMELKVEEETFHTHLAIVYVEHVVRMLRNEQHKEEILVVRQKLQHFLQTSNLYRIHLLLGKIKDANLDKELATLYGKNEEHGKALEILVHKLKDYEAAENYCVANSNEQKNVFPQLLACYLDSSLEAQRKNELIEPALNLLKNHAVAFSASEVLEILPKEWSITVICSFIKESLRSSLHQYRMRKVESALARGDNLHKQFLLYDLHHNSIVMNKTNYCCICNKVFVGASFVRYPNDVITHLECAKKKDICPLTGKSFKRTPAPSS